MCGIFGFQFKSGTTMGEGKRLLLAAKLADLNDRRGGHSWGTCILGNERPRITRGLGDHGDHVRHLIGAESMFGHTRFATHGDKVVTNAHPFEIGNIIGAHNGIFYNHKSLNEKYDRKFAVDSMHAFAHIDAGLPLDDIEGYGTLEWIDKAHPERINLCSVRDGDLSVRGIGKSVDDLQGVVWSSDDRHLTAALAYAGIKKHFTYDVPDYVVHYVEGGRLYIDKAELKVSNSATRITWKDYADWERSKSGTWTKIYVMGGSSFGTVIGGDEDDGTIDAKDEMTIDEIPMEDVLDLDDEDLCEKYGPGAVLARQEAMGDYVSDDPDEEYNARLAAFEAKYGPSTEVSPADEDFNKKWLRQEDADLALLMKGR
jgi:hypothetical protein